MKTFTDEESNFDLINRGDNPEYWEGPSLAVWIYNDKASELFVSGYYENLMFWEKLTGWKPLLDKNQKLLKTVESKLASCNHILIEMDADSDSHWPEASKLAEVIFSHIPNPPGDLNELPIYDSVSPTSNQLPELDFFSKGSKLYDLATTNLPNRQFYDVPLSMCRRHGRVVTSAHWTLCIWETPIEQDLVNWEPDQQRWPHDGIPRFAYQIERDIPFGNAKSNLRKLNELALLAIIERIVVNENNSLQYEFKTEIELLEQSMLKMLENPKSSKFEDIRTTLSELSTYLEMARENHTRLKQRLEVGDIRKALNETSSYSGNTLQEDIDELDRRISEGHKSLLALIKFIPVLQNEISVKFRQYASSFAIVFSLATLAVTIYGDNVREATLPSNNDTWFILIVISVIFLALGIIGVPAKNIIKLIDDKIRKSIKAIGKAFRRSGH